MNEYVRRKVPLDAPVKFISNRWSRYVFEDDCSVNRHYYEMPALSELKNKIRSGDVSVEGSRNQKDFDEYLLINAISIWNTVYLQEAVNHLKNNGGFDEELLKKISPLGRDHISLLGEYHFKARDMPKGSSLRPLNI